MSRTSRVDAIETTHKLRAWRQFRGLTLEALGEAIGMSSQNLGRIERGIVPLSEEHHARLAKALQIEVADLFREPNGTGETSPLVPIIGRVGADNEGTVIYTTGQASGDLVPIPPGGGDTSRALEVVGHSGGEWAPPGSIIYFEDQRHPPTPDMLGYPCVVETDDGRVLLKRLLRGSKAGLFDLESRVGPTLVDVRLRWAAEVTYVAQPKQAQRIIRRHGVSQVA